MIDNTNPESLEPDAGTSPDQPADAPTQSRADGKAPAERASDPAAEAAASSNGKDTNGEPDPWPQPVNGVELLDDLVSVFRRYLALPDGSPALIALWVAFTHLIDISTVAPRLAILSPVRRCGKTTLLSLLIRLVRRPLPASNVTPAVVFRAIDKYQPTLLIDEADTFLGDRRELIGILNSGHTKDTAFILRSDGEKFEPRRFPTFAAISIAQIGKLPASLEDRSIVIWMRRRRHDETVDKFRENRTSDLVELRRKIMRWVIDNRAALMAADPEMPNNLNDRAADNCRILLAVADVAGSHWPEIARHVVATIAGDKEDVPVMLLNDIEEIFDDRQLDRISSADLCDKLIEREDRPWCELEGYRITPHRLADLLDPFGIQPKTIRVGERTLRGYMRTQFEDAFARYPRPQTATPQQDCDFNGLGAEQSATQPATAEPESATAPNLVVDGAGDVAEGVAVAQDQKINEINDVADVSVAGGKVQKPKGRASIDMRAVLTMAHPSPVSDRRSRRRHRDPRHT
jgi:hypothetical protein